MSTEHTTESKKNEPHRILAAIVICGETAEFRSEDGLSSFFPFCTTTNRCTTNLSAYRIVLALLHKIWSRSLGPYLFLLEEGGKMRVAKASAF